MEIAAECKAFLGLGWEAEWDVSGLVDGGWGQDTRTVFKGVQKVGLEYELEKECYLNEEVIADEDHVVETGSLYDL